MYIISKNVWKNEKHTFRSSNKLFVVFLVWFWAVFVLCLYCLMGTKQKKSVCLFFCGCCTFGFVLCLFAVQLAHSSVRRSLHYRLSILRFMYFQKCMFMYSVNLFDILLFKFTSLCGFLVALFVFIYFLNKQYCEYVVCLFNLNMILWWQFPKSVDYFFFFARQ